MASGPRDCRSRWIKVPSCLRSPKSRRSIPAMLSSDSMKPVILSVAFNVSPPFFVNHTAPPWGEERHHALFHLTSYAVSCKASELFFLSSPLGGRCGSFLFFCLFLLRRQPTLQEWVCLRSVPCICIHGTEILELLIDAYASGSLSLLSFTRPPSRMTPIFAIFSASCLSLSVCFHRVASATSPATALMSVSIFQPPAGAFL